MTRAFVDGRPVVVTGEWEDATEAGCYYRFEGESRTHWIRYGNVRLSFVELR